MANLKDGTTVSGDITGDLKGNADTATYLQSTNITSGQNLNNITTPGLYICANSTIAASLSNSPITSEPFSMRVDSTGAGIRQTIYNSSTSTPKTIIRTKSGSTFTSWNTITGI